MFDLDDINRGSSNVLLRICSPFELCLVENNHQFLIKYPHSTEEGWWPFRDCGLSFREIGSCAGRNQITVMRISDRWMQEGSMDRRGRSHPPQCTTSHEDRQIVRMAVMDCSVTSQTIAQHIESVTHHSVCLRVPFDAVYSRVVCPQDVHCLGSTLDAEPQTSPPPMVR
ncbi:uncharacterized protein TNCV_4976121 [Trichonephila clavipes]|uniref:Uncharacterized protein n=1 Tax=Trichonephila clavipes TaxID=2585209 RepID=A0A8X6VBF9_TRICX|nr:uncharacterized protein TNCV_4976121 [Trichonephila clavipes]